MSSASGLQPFLGGDRFATITPNDHGGVVWVASILCAIFSLSTFFLRCYTKRKYFGLDDWLAAAATVRRPATINSEPSPADDFAGDCAGPVRRCFCGNL